MGSSVLGAAQSNGMPLAMLEAPGAYWRLLSLKIIIHKFQLLAVYDLQG